MEERNTSIKCAGWNVRKEYQNKMCLIMEKRNISIKCTRWN